MSFYLWVGSSTKKTFNNNSIKGWTTKLCIHEIVNFIQTTKIDFLKNTNIYSNQFQTNQQALSHDRNQANHSEHLRRVSFHHRTPWMYFILHVLGRHFDLKKAGHTNSYLLTLVMHATITDHGITTPTHTCRFLNFTEPKNSFPAF